jgi:hypothetical protein
MTRFENSIKDPTPADDWEKYSRGSKGGVEFCNERSPEEIIQYRRDRIQHPIFRWLRDGKYRIDQIVSDKIKSYHKYKASYNFRTDGYIPSRQKDYEAKLRRILNRTKFYMDKSKEIGFIIENYENYTYEELCVIPEIILYDDRGWRI